MGANGGLTRGALLRLALAALIALAVASRLGSVGACLLVVGDPTSRCGPTPVAGLHDGGYPVRAPLVAIRSR